MSSSLIRQDLVPIVIGYLLVMGALAAGLGLIRRDGDNAAAGSRAPGERAPGERAPGERAPGERAPAGDEAGIAAAGAAPAGGALAGAARAGGGQPGGGRLSRARRLRPAVPQPGWPRLIRHYLGTAIGGYLLLMAVVILYYYGVARVGGTFIESAFTGCALLLALSTPVFLLASWLAERRPASRLPQLTHRSVHHHPPQDG